MNKTIFQLIFLFIFSSGIFAFEAKASGLVCSSSLVKVEQAPRFRSYPKEVHPIVQKLLGHSDFVGLLSEVQKVGSVAIVFSYSWEGDFHAFWDPEKRQIVLNRRVSTDPSAWVTSIVFELHNALREKDFEYWTQQALLRKISREQFIEAFERIEHKNGLDACRLIRDLVDQKVFDASILSWWVDPSFEKHFAIQKKMGHSSWIGKEYDRVVSHRLARSC